MTKKQQFDTKQTCSDLEKNSLAKNLLTLGAVATLTAALAAKAALATLNPAPVSQAMDQLQVSSPKVVAEAPAKSAAPEQSEAGISEAPIVLARVTPETAQLLPTAVERNSAKFSLTHHLAKLKLRRALLAAQAAKKNKAIEIAPAEGAVIAEAIPPALPPQSLLQQQTETMAVVAEVEFEEKPATEHLSSGTQAPPLPMIDEALPAIDAPLQVASVVPMATLPVPGKRPRPLVRSKPATAEKPGAITKPRRAAKNKDKPRPAKPAPVLAYASPQEPKSGRGAFDGLGKLFNGRKGGLPGRGSGIAVYDISAAVVHMPDGTKLEAHSGIGHRKDNPKFAYVKNLGPTPPNIYKLRMRESLFHGVEAIRMLPVDRAAMKGRDGMLAHTPLLKRTNGSHGCVAFNNYNKFLKAFKAGKVKTMIVVPSMEKLPTYMAKLNRSQRG